MRWFLKLTLFVFDCRIESYPFTVCVVLRCLRTNIVPISLSKWAVISSVCWNKNQQMSYKKIEPNHTGRWHSKSHWLWMTLPFNLEICFLFFSHLMHLLVQGTKLGGPMLLKTLAELWSHLCHSDYCEDLFGGDSTNTKNWKIWKHEWIQVERCPDLVANHHMFAMFFVCFCVSREWIDMFPRWRTTTTRNVGSSRSCALKRVNGATWMGTRVPHFC